MDGQDKAPGLGPVISTLSDIRVHNGQLVGSVMGSGFAPGDLVYLNDALPTRTTFGDSTWMTFAIPFHLCSHFSSVAVSVVAQRDVKIPRTSSLTLDLTTLAPELPRTGPEAMAHLVAELVPELLLSNQSRRYFALWERAGFHITPVHFYQPIPDTRTLTNELFSRRSSLAGIDLKTEAQLRLLRDVFPRFRHEYATIPIESTGDDTEFYVRNGAFERSDAYVLYCLMRHLKPRRMIEVGSGASTLLAARAARVNGNTRLCCIDPYPSDVIRRGFDGLSELLPLKVQDVPLALFEELEENDILFIDSSHVVQINSDVNYLFLEVLPRLRKGVVVHVHDIFLPFEYPRYHLDHGLFWNEQYLLQAFLIFNSHYEVLFGNAYMYANYERDIQEAFPDSPRGTVGSFWMRRKT